MTRTRFMLAASVALAIGLSGCTAAAAPEPTASAGGGTASASSQGAGATTAPGGTSTPASVATPDESAAASDSASPTPTHTGLLLSSEGLGPLRIGQPVPAGQKLAVWNDDACGKDIGDWKTTYGVADTSGAWPFAIWNSGKKNDPIAVISISSSSITTEHGLHVGSSLTDIKKLGAVKVADKDGFGQGTQGWAIRGSVGELIMWVKHSRVEYLAVEKKNPGWRFFPWEGPCG